VTNGAPVTEVVRTVAPPPPAQQVASGCPGVTGPQHSVIGVAVGQQVDYSFPFPVSVDTADIGGPSAGLAMTLGIMDRLSSGSLTGPHPVAATGEITPQGDVEAVGGVPQKTIAVERAGAVVFMVPPANFADALSKQNSSLHVCRVADLGQALGVLARYGGDVPRSLHPTPVAPGQCR
jgi:PDZ domain-containing protein